MEPDPAISRLTQRQQAEEQARQQTAPVAREFATPEELLRLDAAQNPPPPRVEERLQQSLATEPAPAQPWWRRLFRR
ncbi:MAG: hypothetical protein ABSC03_17265, partial [Verrucomicrobiota bacterium]|jgi:hypothetical protein